MNILKHALTLGVLAAMSLSMSAFAMEGPYATFDIKVENTAVDSDVSPMVTMPITKDQVQFHIINNTDKPLFFMNGANGQGQSYVPLVSNSTVTVPYQPGQEYKLVDADGKTVAKWNLENRMAKPQVANVMSASPSQFAEWGNTLQQVMENQKVSYQALPTKMEPHYYTKHHPMKRSIGHNKPSSHTAHRLIRGYW